MAALLGSLRSRLWTLLFVVAAAAATAPVAAAQDNEQPQWTVDSLTFVGVERIDESALRAVLATRESSWVPWRDKAPFDPIALELDLRRIVAYYRDHGFPDAHVVSHEVETHPESNTVDITIRVDEGQPVIVTAIDLEGFDVLSAHGLEELRAVLPITVGDIAVNDQVLAGAQLAVNALKNRGYAYAEVDLGEEMPDPYRLRIRYAAIPGIQAYFGPVEVVGNASVSDDIVRRQLTYRPGDLFRVDQVKSAQRQLYGLELFQFAVIDPLESAEPRDVPTRVTVAEGKHRRLRFAAGWGTEEKARGEAMWRHVNFFGGARVLAARGKWSSLDSGGELDFTQPYFFDPKLALVLNAHSLYANELAYRAWSQGGRLALNGRVSPRTKWTLTYTHEDARSEVSDEALNDPTIRDSLIALGLDPTTGEQDGLLSSLSLGVEHTTADNLLNPRRGYSMAAQVEQAGTVLPGSFNYTRLNLDLRGYLPVTDRLIVAARVRGSAIDPAGGPEDVPFYQRYFLGGSTSLRGWGRYEVAPLSGAGLPVGGFSLLESNLELRAGVWKDLGVVLFVDAGNVWNGEWEFHPGDLRYDVGPGLRYQTPVGPLRVDLGYQLTPIEGLVVDGEPSTRRWRVHFSIGQSF
jgi:outer membrane protein insertion porin family/translocation and assembly module TamA